MKISTLAQSLAVLSLFAVGAASAAEMGGNPLADHVRTANDRFKDVKVATAEGYGPIPCADGLEGGSMGVHYVNMDYLKDDAVNLDKPEAILYEPEADGTMKLMAVEYITYKGPNALEGHLFNFLGTPNRYGLPALYELHVWAWQPNHAGTFADMNMDASCAAMPTPAK